jgi:hypothetical protein
MTKCRMAGAQIVSPPSSKRYASGKLITVARRTDARAIGHGIDVNSTRWTPTNGRLTRGLMTMKHALTGGLGVRSGEGSERYDGLTLAGDDHFRPRSNSM